MDVARALGMERLSSWHHLIPNASVRNVAMIRPRDRKYVKSLYNYLF